MDEKQTRLVDQVVWDALRIEVEDRPRFLSERLGEHPDLLERAQQRLAARLSEGDNEAYLVQLARRVGLEALHEPASRVTGEPAVGRRYGPFSTLALLGHGGMGAVYLAERVDADFEQRVAIKIVAPGRETSALASRLKRERRILASLEHPNIARLFDGGVGSEGEPYLAMEFVEGVPITKYCDDRGASLDERLRLFLDVASAVQFAHGRLVIHRDLKPSNVLVTPRGEVKLLDFGISQLLAGDEAEAEDARKGEAPMTPAYASPEQLKGDEITVSADVFALGILLYELIAGKHPFRDDGASLELVARQVLDSDPSSPVDSHPARATYDLGLVCLKALEKEPGLRYASAAAFAEDVSRFRSGQTVAARRSTLRYQVTRFVGRHRAATAASLLAGTALIGGLAATSWQAHAAANEAARASRINSFVLDLFRASDPNVARGETLTARELLDRGVERLDIRFDDQPSVKAEMLGVLGPIYRELGLYEDAEALLDTALAVVSREKGQTAPEVTTVLNELARVNVLAGAYERADSLYRVVLARYEEARGDRGFDLGNTRGELGYLLIRRGENAEGAALIRAALDDPQFMDQAGNEVIAMLRLQYADALHRLKRWDEATDAFRTVAQSMATQSPTDDLTALAAVETYAQQLAVRNGRDAAVELLVEALAVRVRVLGEDHVAVAHAKSNLAPHLMAMDRREEAERLLRDALAVQTQTLGEDHLSVAQANIVLASLLFSTGRTDESALTYRRAIRGFDAMGPVPNLYATNARRNLGRVLGHAGHAAEAGQVLSAAYADFVELEGTDYLFAIQTLTDLAGVRLQDGDVQAADSLSRMAVAAYERRGRSGTGQGVALTLRANVLNALGESVHADSTFRMAIQVLDSANQGKGDPVQRSATQTSHGKFLFALGRTQEAEEILLEAYAVLSRERPAAHMYPTLAREALRTLYEARGDTESAGLYADPP